MMMDDETATEKGRAAKKMMFDWLVSLMRDNKEALDRSLQAKEVVPDVKDVVALLRAGGFRLTDVRMGDPAPPGTSLSTGCRVTVSCWRSGLRAELEADAECRCPAAADAHAASAWVVEAPCSPYASRESLERSGQGQAGSSLLPELPATVSDVVGAVTRALLRFAEEKANTAAGASLRSLPRSSSFQGNLSNRSATTELHRSLDNLHIQTEMEVDGVTCTVSALAAPPPPPPPPPPAVRRQSTTLEDYADFRRLLADSQKAASMDEDTTRRESSLLLGYRPNVTADLPSLEPAVLLQRAEGALNIMREVTELLKSWTVGEVSTGGVGRARQQSMPRSVPLPMSSRSPSALPVRSQQMLKVPSTFGGDGPRPSALARPSSAQGTPRRFRSPAQPRRHSLEGTPVKGALERCPRSGPRAAPGRSVPRPYPASARPAATTPFPAAAASGASARRAAARGISVGTPRPALMRYRKYPDASPSNPDAQPSK